MKVLLVVFLRENLILGNLIFLGHCFMFHWVGSKLSQATVIIGFLNSQDMISFMITTRSLNSQDVIKILKQSGHNFSGKCLCDGYCMEILCDVYVWRSIFNRRLYGFVKKASLRICYKFCLNVKVFECSKLTAYSFREILHISQHNKFCGAARRKYDQWKLKIFCLVTVCRLEFVSLPIADQFQSNFHNLPFVKQRIIKLDRKSTMYNVAKCP